MRKIQLELLNCFVWNTLGCNSKQLITLLGMFIRSNYIYTQALSQELLCTLCTQANFHTWLHTVKSRILTHLVFRLLMKGILTKSWLFKQSYSCFQHMLKLSFTYVVNCGLGPTLMHRTVKWGGRFRIKIYLNNLCQTKYICSHFTSFQRRLGHCD